MASAQGWIERVALSGAPANIALSGTASSSLLGLALKHYLISLNQHPLRTKSFTSGVIAGLSDIIAQRLIKGSWNYDHNWKRTFAIVLYGVFWSGPSAHYWQKFMEYAFQGKTDTVTVLKKVLVDQSSYGPICNIMFMAFATVVLEGRSVQMFSSKVRRDYPLVQLNGWKVWPLAALINYRFVPLQFRVLFINCVALAWSIFLLLRARKLSQGTPSSGKTVVSPPPTTPTEEKGTPSKKR